MPVHPNFMRGPGLVASSIRARNKNEANRAPPNVGDAQQEAQTLNNRPRLPTAKPPLTESKIEVRASTPAAPRLGNSTVSHRGSGRVPKAAPQTKSNVPTAREHLAKLKKTLKRMKSEQTDGYLALIDLNSSMKTNPAKKDAIEKQRVTLNSELETLNKKIVDVEAQIEQASVK